MGYQETLPPLTVKQGEQVSFTLNTSDRDDIRDLGDITTFNAGTLNWAPEEAAANPPDGLEVTGDNTDPTLSGVVTAAADVTGSYFITPGYLYRGVVYWWIVPVHVEAVVKSVDRPERPTMSDRGVIELPAVEGVDWFMNGSPVEPGSYTLAAGEETMLSAAAAEGWQWSDGTAEPITWTYTRPDDSDDTGEADLLWPEEITEIGRKVAAWLGWSTDDQLQRASFYAHIVCVYVDGYTRGRGFNADGNPDARLQRVIVSAAARLARNPDGLRRLDIDNVSESLTVFQGFHLAELAVLNNYRRRYA